MPKMVYVHQDVTPKSTRDANRLQDPALAHPLSVQHIMWRGPHSFEQAFSTARAARIPCTLESIDTQSTQGPALRACTPAFGAAHHVAWSSLV